MRPTSDAPDETADRDPYDAEPARNDPWATGPANATQQDDQTERFIPEQRDSDHHGHLYASDTYAEPETTVLPADTKPEGHHDSDEPAAVGVAPVDAPVDVDKTDADKTDEDTDDSPKADEAKADDEPTVVSRDEPEVVVEPVADPVPVAVVEPATDDRGELTAVPVAVPVSAEEPADEPTDEPADEPTTELKPGDVPVAPVAGFFAADAAQGLRDRWRDAQFGFVDDPRKAVDDVKALVGEAVDQFTAAVSAQRDELDAAAGDDTEQYRVAVQRYRAFFDRLLDL